MYHALSERLFTSFVILVELKIKATYVICLYLVKMILTMWFLMYLRISQLHFNILFLQWQNKRQVIWNPESGKGNILLILPKLLCFCLTNIYVEVYIWVAIKFSQFSFLTHAHIQVLSHRQLFQCMHSKHVNLL